MSRAIFGILLLATAGYAADFPAAEIGNGLIKAKLYLPDAGHGYYRATRFDWSGVIASLDAGGHSYFGEWFDEYDPHRHDSITGPVEEFQTGSTALGYEEAAPGATFIRIGVGTLRKPEEPAFRRFHTYEIVNHGKWTINAQSDAITFTHELTDAASGYGYVYRKTVRLVPGRAEMILEHSLRNTGRQPIRTSVYNHNFFLIDNQRTGPAFTVDLAFAPHSTRDLRGFAVIQGRRVSFLKDFQERDRVRTDLTGFSESVADHVIEVVNRTTGAGVRVTGDRPLSSMVFWSANRVISPENYITMDIDPGRTFTWNLSYQFFATSSLQ